MNHMGICHMGICHMGICHTFDHVYSRYMTMLLYAFYLSFGSSEPADL